MRIGMLTGGGDCPGLNAVIRAVVRKGILHYNDEFIGFREGWRGVIDDRTMPLNLETTSGILHRGGHHPPLLTHQREEDRRRIRDLPQGHRRP